MKRLFTAILSFSLLMMAFTLNAQSPRMVVVEEATQASCPPCATLNPPLQATLNANPDKAIFIGYQVWWPGVDAMYEDNPDEVQARINYYGINAAPNIVVQGNSNPQSTSYLTQTLIDNTYAEMSDFDIDLAVEIVNGEVVISGSVTASADVEGDLRLHLLVTEGLIHGTDLAFEGTNGETEFHHVFKKFVNGPDGITLADSWAAGDTYTINETYTHGSINIYDYAELEVIALVQDNSSRFIHQAAKADDLNITVDATNNAAAGDASMFDAVCPGSQMITPSFDLVNNGGDDLTSATISYSVNGGSEQVFAWTGSLPTFGKETVELLPIAYQTEATNTLSINITEPNGATDEDLSDNDTSVDLPLAPDAGVYVTVEIQTDFYGDEVYWEIRDPDGNVVASGGNPNVGIDNINTGNFPAPPHADMYANNTFYSHNVDILDLGCYTFHITDYFGDGMSLPNAGPAAFYRLIDNGGNVMIQSADNPSYIEVERSYNGDMVNGIEEFAVENSIKVFPNPVTNVANVSFNLIAQADATLTVMNTLGQQVMVKDLGTLTTGQYNEEVNMSNLSNGFYLVQLQLDNETITMKVNVSK